MELRTTSTSKVRNAVVKSMQAVEKFANTVSQLEKANDKLDEAIEQDLAQIRELELNVQDARHRRGKNTEIINKINSIID